MKTLLSILGIIAVIALLFYVVGRKENVPAVTIDAEREEIREIPVEVTPISHATAFLEWDDTTFLLDPVGTSTQLRSKTADIILITDIHADHLSTSTLNTLLGTSTTVGTSTATGTPLLIVPQAVDDLLPESFAPLTLVLDNNESTTTEQGFRITAVPMYNLPEATTSRHIKGRGNGYLIERDDFRVYIAGDTAGTPEMRALTDIDIAFVPMNLPFTMSVEEAADAVIAFKPRQVYPYHYRGQDGLSDVNRFKDLIERADDNIEVIQLNWYPTR